MTKKQNKLLLVLIVIIAVNIVAAVLINKFKPQKPDYQPLIGRWIRPDGGYILEIKSIANNGQAEAVYLNPSPINISKANAKVVDDKLELFVELRDRNYPGNYYELTYGEQTNRLIGVYYLPTLNEKYDIFFIKK